MPGYGKTHYDCTRCELNAFSSDELAEFIEAGLHGTASPRSSCPHRTCWPSMCRRSATRRSPRWSGPRSRTWSTSMPWCARLVADHPDLADVDEARIRDTFTDNPTQSWRSSAQQLVTRGHRRRRRPRRGAPRARLAENLRKGGRR